MCRITYAISTEPVTSPQLVAMATRHLGLFILLKDCIKDGAQPWQRINVMSQVPQVSLLKIEQDIKLV